jgi:primase-polymerase (primpol)-like protein
MQPILDMLNAVLWPLIAVVGSAGTCVAILSCRSSVKFNALYKGDISGYPSHSHAESALVFMLAWWTQDPAQIDGIVRSSGLIRPKWDERRGGTTYGGQLIDEALSTVRQRGQPQYAKKSQYCL